MHTVVINSVIYNMFVKEGPKGPHRNVATASLHVMHTCSSGIGAALCTTAQVSCSLPGSGAVAYRRLSRHCNGFLADSSQ